MIEPAAATLAAGRSSEAEVEEIETALGAMEEAAAVDDRDSYLAADLRFHTVILEACYNELLAYLGGTLRAVSARASPSVADRPGDDRRTASRRRSVSEDEPAAELAMRDLIERMAASLADDAPTAAPLDLGAGSPRVRSVVLESTWANGVGRSIYIGERLLEAVAGNR